MKLQSLVKSANLISIQKRLGQKYAAVNGVTAARRHFRSELGDLPESTCTIRKYMYKNLYTAKLAACAKQNDVSEITTLLIRK